MLVQSEEAGRCCAGQAPVAGHPHYGQQGAGGDGRIVRPHVRGRGQGRPPQHCAREAAARQVKPEGEVTLGADKGYDAAEFIQALQERKLIEQGFGWAKFIGPIRQVMVRGIKKVDQLFMLTMAAYNLVRVRTLGQIRLEPGR